MLRIQSALGLRAAAPERPPHFTLPTPSPTAALFTLLNGLSCFVPILYTSSLYSAQIKLRLFLHSSVRPSFGPNLYSQTFTNKTFKFSSFIREIIQYLVFRGFQKVLHSYVTVRGLRPPHHQSLTNKQLL